MRETTGYRFGDPGRAAFDLYLLYFAGCFNGQVFVKHFIITLFEYPGKKSGG
jgi:hypothetical protein